MSELLVESPDGTAISSESTGDGPALVMLSGALFAARGWASVVTRLSEARCVYVIDRRGRGRSGDSATYAPEREVEDVLAVLRAIPGPIDVLGHSSGAILGLRVAAAQPSKLRRLVLYEPPLFYDEADLIQSDLPERLDALLAAGRSQDALETFFREGPRMPESELQALQASPAWAAMAADLAHTVAYDSRLQRSFAGHPSELALVHVPTLLLLGSASPMRMQRATGSVAKGLPNARVVELAGQQHIAMLLAPAPFANAVSAFLDAPEAPPP